MLQALDDLKQVKFKLTATVNVIISSMSSSDLLVIIIFSLGQGPKAKAIHTTHKTKEERNYSTTQKV